MGTLKAPIGHGRTRWPVELHVMPWLYSHACNERRPRRRLALTGSPCCPCPCPCPWSTPSCQYYYIVSEPRGTRPTIQWYGGLRVRPYTSTQNCKSGVPIENNLQYLKTMIPQCVYDVIEFGLNDMILHVLHVGKFRHAMSRGLGEWFVSSHMCLMSVHR